MFFKSRALQSLFVLAVAALLTAGQALAQNTLKVVSATGAEGKDVTVKVTLTTSANIAGIEFKVAFDATKLMLKEVAKGAAAASMTMTDPTVFVVGDSSVAADSGKLVVQMFDSTLVNPIPSGADREVLLLTFGIASGASGGIPVSLSEASLSDPITGSVAVTTTNGVVTVGPGVDVVLSVTSAQGPAGADVTVKVMADAYKDLEAMSFSLVYNQELLTLKSTARGANAPGVDSLDTLTDLETANAAGKMDVSLFNFFYGTADSKPLTTGTNREVFKFTFTIAGSAADGDIPITLSGVEVDGVVADSAAEFTSTVHAGVITVGGAPGDADGNGKIDVFDLLDLLKVLGGSKQPSAFSDVNGDGKSDVFDLLALLKKLAGG